MAVGDMVESLLPAMVRLNVATAEEVDLPTLRDRLWEEVTAGPRVIVERSEIGIWTRVGLPTDLARDTRSPLRG